MHLNELHDSVYQSLLEFGDMCLRKHSSLILPFSLYCAVEIFIMIFIFMPLEHAQKCPTVPGIPLYHTTFKCVLFHTPLPQER